MSGSRCGQSEIKRSSEVSLQRCHISSSLDLTLSRQQARQLPPVYKKHCLEAPNWILA